MRFCEVTETANTVASQSRLGEVRVVNGSAAVIKYPSEPGFTHHSIALSKSFHVFISCFPQQSNGQDCMIKTRRPLRIDEQCSLRGWRFHILGLGSRLAPRNQLHDFPRRVLSLVKRERNLGSLSQSIVRFSRITNFVIRTTKCQIPLATS